MTLSRPDDFDAEELAIDERKHGIDGAAYQPGSAEFSGPLESSVPLEAPRVRYIAVANSPTLFPATDERSISQLVSQPTTPATVANQPNEIVIPLLAERVVVDRRRRKLGEVVVRKEIETHIVEVPVRREKLIVEQVSPEYQQIAVVELGQAPVNESDTLEAVEITNSPIVNGEFASANAAIHFLNAIASEFDSGLEKVQVRVVLDDATRQTTYQRWLDQYSTEFTP